MFKQLEGVVFDWAGTTVDYGCFAPVKVFLSIFEAMGLPVTEKEARIPMGLLKWDHIKEMLEMNRIQMKFQDIHGRASNNQDVDRLFEAFEPKLLSILKNYASPIDHVIDTVNSLKAKGLKIGSTTGYNQIMIDIVSKEANKLGYFPDSIVTPNQTQNYGRPYPYMIFRNIERLNIMAPWRVVKVGDTIADIKEGVNAGVWTVGVVRGSSQVGLTQDQLNALSDSDRNVILTQARQAFLHAGAHVVVDTLEEFEALCIKIEVLVASGVKPCVI